jgi:hypothetical protein
MITRASLRAARACYPDARIAELVPAEGLSPAQVAALDIPAEDRHWALRCAAGADEATLRRHACWCARRALARVAAPDPRSVAAIDVAERYAAGEATQAEMSAAGDAAWDAARAAAGAAWAAARDAALAAARAAVAAAEAAEREAQIADLVARLEEDR